MNPKPFRRRLFPRATPADLPGDLANFYSKYEGVGRESTPDRVIRICRLEDAKRISWKDLHVVGGDDVPAWSSFSAIRIGMSCYFDEIVYVLECPSCAAGSILALGPDMTNGPGGTGPDMYEMSLVLASSFQNWIRHMKELLWNEPGIGCSLIEFDGAQEAEMKNYYRALNPHSGLWGSDDA